LGERIVRVAVRRSVICNRDVGRGLLRNDVFQEAVEEFSTVFDGFVGVGVELRRETMSETRRMTVGGGTNLGERVEELVEIDEEFSLSDFRLREKGRLLRLGEEKRGKRGRTMLYMLSTAK
jgi:hypothetical protein